MRTKPLIGRKAWFGPRRGGWGLTAVTAEGWAVLVIGVAAAVVLEVTVSKFHWLGLLPLAVMVALVFLKGTSLGGAAERAEFQASRGKQEH